MMVETWKPGEVCYVCHECGKVEHPGCGRMIGPFPCCTVVEGDCLELMKQLPDGCVDLLWTDPPYGHGNHDGDWNARLNEHRGIENKPIANDDGEGMRRVVDYMLKEAARALNCCCCCCCCSAGGGPSPTFGWLAQRMDSEGLRFFHCVIWDKLNPGLGWRYRRQSEFVMVAHRLGGTLLWNEEKEAVPNIVHFFPGRDRLHPNEKPEGFVLPFVERHSLPGDLVLDPFLGSGTTAVAAKKLGRHFLGFEISPEYCRIARERIALVEAQPSLFERKPEQLELP